MDDKKLSRMTTATNDNYIRGGRQKNIYEASEVEKCNCPLCGSDRPEHVYTERKSLEIVKCGHCGLIYVSPRVKQAETNYWGDADIYMSEARLIFTGKKKHHRDPNYIYELKKIKKFKAGGVLLDIGCSMGFFLNRARAFGYEVCGVEPSPSLSRIAAEQFGLKIINSYFERGVVKAGSVDVITMIDVFEHVTNPSELLKAAQEALKDDGIMCIKVPNGKYNLLKLKLARLSGREKAHDLFDSYEHVVHYTKDTIRKMLDQNGFTIKKIIIPLPIHPPVWAAQVGHYYQYPSPFVLDWKRIMLRNIFYYLGKMGHALGTNASFAPDLMIIAGKKK
jgi:2-polyprenyl-3-methyl-5-hydroxy-6-metoxy-1,4-benzoquinol methylase